MEGQAPAETIESPDHGPSRPLTLLYIAGAHRSGATPLGAVLAGEPTVFYGGELYRFPDPIFTVPDRARLCSCGVPVVECPFWTEVRSRLESEPGMLQQLREGQFRFERWSALPRTLWKLRRGDPELREHVRRMGRFIRILADLSGATTIVESSYNPVRGLLYRDTGSGVAVRFLHLVRDGRNFVDSEQKATDRPESRWGWVRARPVIVSRWVAYHLLSWVLLRPRRLYRRLRYEDLVRNPDRSLPVLSDLLGVDLSGVLRQVKEGTPIRMRHIAAGNRMRASGEVRLRPELAETARLPLATRALFWGIGGWLALGLGYRPGRSRRSGIPFTNAPT